MRKEYEESGGKNTVAGCDVFWEVEATLFLIPMLATSQIGCRYVYTY